MEVVEPHRIVEPHRVIVLLPLSEGNIKLLSQFYDYWAAVDKVVYLGLIPYVKLREEIISSLPIPLRKVAILCTESLCI